MSNPTPDPTSATLDEIRDWFARRTHTQHETRHELWQEDCRIDADWTHHPIPATLDAIAALMPKDWWWSRFETVASGVKWNAGPYGGFDRVSVFDTGDELLDRARLALAATLNNEAKKGTP